MACHCIFYSALQQCTAVVSLCRVLVTTELVPVISVFFTTSHRRGAASFVCRTFFRRSRKNMCDVLGGWDLFRRRHKKNGIFFANVCLLVAFLHVYWSSFSATG